LLYPDGAKDVKLGSPLCILAYDPKDIPALADWSPSGSASKAESAQPAQAESAPQAQSKPQAAQSSGERIFISPLAKKTAEEKGVDIT